MTKFTQEELDEINSTIKTPQDSLKWARLEVPPGREDAVSGPRHDPDAQLRVVAQLGESLAQHAAGCVVDCIHLGPVQRDLENRSAPHHLHLFAHVCRLPLVIRRAKSINLAVPSPGRIREFIPQPTKAKARIGKCLRFPFNDQYVQ